ncbi:unnamed protein product [Linum trigynum]|uniref:Reverse transcriptase domain-containing protein n=1 Tax=Linum trigynum TaxID=586398 RepID=A0AAV2GAC1_9ROSI
MPLILGRPFLATSKALIDVNAGTLFLRDGEERITLGIEPKPRSEHVRKVEPGDMNASGVEPFKVNHTITFVPCDDVKQESKEGISPKEGRKRAWRERMNHANAQWKEKGKAKVICQEGHPIESKLGGDMHRPEIVADPLSIASRSKG